MLMIKQPVIMDTFKYAWGSPKMKIKWNKTNKQKKLQSFIQDEKYGFASS